MRRTFPPPRSLFVLVLLSALGCRERPQQVTIALAFPEFGRAIAELAQAELDTWTELPAPIALAYDTAAVDETAQAEVSRAIRMAALPGVVAVVGHGGSRGSLAGAPIYNERGIVQIVPTGTSPLLASAGPWTLTLAPNDTVQGRFIAQFIERNLGRRRAVVFHVHDEYGYSLRDGLNAALPRHGIEIVRRVGFSKSSDFDPLVRAALAGDSADVVIVAGRDAEAGRILAIAYHVAPHLVYVAGDGVELNSAVTVRGGPAVDSLYAVSFWSADLPHPESRAFVQALRARWPNAHPMGPHALRYDAVMLLATTIRAVGPDPTTVRAFLLSLGVTRPPYAGVSGPISFAVDRTYPMLMLRARDRQRVPLAEP